MKYCKKHENLESEVKQILKEEEEERQVGGALIWAGRGRGLDMGREGWVFNVTEVYSLWSPSLPPQCPLSLCAVEGIRDGVEQSPELD